MSRGCLWDLTNYFEICLLKVITKFMAKLAIQLEENKILLIFCYTNIRLKCIKNKINKIGPKNIKDFMEQKKILISIEKLQTWKKYF